MKNNFDYDLFRKIISDYVDEMYSMEKGVAIFQPNAKLQLGDSYLVRSRIKHIVEERKEEGRSKDHIKQLLFYLPEVITSPDFELPNTNLRHLGSIMRVKILKGRNGGGVAVLSSVDVRDDHRNIITAFVRNARGIKKLKQKLQESASGETPHF